MGLFIHINTNMNMKGEPRLIGVRGEASLVGESKSQRKKRNLAKNKAERTLLLLNESPIREEAILKVDSFQEAVIEDACLKEEVASTILKEESFLRIGDRREEKYEGNDKFKELLNSEPSGRRPNKKEPLWVQNYFNSSLVPPVPTPSIHLSSPPPFFQNYLFSSPVLPIPPTPIHLNSPPPYTMPNLIPSSSPTLSPPIFLPPLPFPPNLPHPTSRSPQFFLPSNTSPPVATKDIIYDWELPDTGPLQNTQDYPTVRGELSDNWDDDL
jgi:hypothetical protein